MLSADNAYFKKKTLCNTCGKKLHVLGIMEANMCSKNVILFHKAQLLFSPCWFYMYNTHPVTVEERSAYHHWSHVDVQ